MRAILPTPLAQIIDQSSSFLLATHEGPDGDAIGSMLGLGHILRSWGKEVFVYSPHPLEAKYDSLAAGLPSLHAPPANPASFTLVILDAGGRERVPLSLEGYNRMISIDHHPGSDLPGDFSWCEPKASSTGEILASFFLDEPIIPQQACACLYYAILADTNGFQFTNTGARTLELAARLVSKGAHPDQLANLFFNRWRERDIRYFAMAMSSLEYLEGVACARLPLESGVGEEYDSDILMNEWRRWPDPIVYALFKETEPERYKVSLRSHGAVDVSQVARLFQGGGHAAASGCRLEGSYHQVQQRLVEAFRELLRHA